MIATVRAQANPTDTMSEMSLPNAPGVLRCFLTEGGGGGAIGGAGAATGSLKGSRTGSGTPRWGSGMLGGRNSAI